jgi:DNA repair exonuclease SbcCD ATPase subunit
MNAAHPSAQPDANSLQVWMFESVLRAFGAGNVTVDDVLGRLRRLLAAGMPATELLEIVGRSHLPPESARPVADFLNDATRWDAPKAAESSQLNVHPSKPHEKNTESRAEQGSLRELPSCSAERNGDAEAHIEARPAAIGATEATTLALAADLADTRAKLAAQERRVRDLCVELAEKNLVLEGARSRIAEILRDYERQGHETQTLRNSLEARDAALDKIQAALEQRDAELAALRREQGHAASTLEAHVQRAERLGADLQAALASAEAASLELKEGHEARCALEMNLKRCESHLKDVSIELAASETRSTSYLELLRTRAWRRGFHQNMMRDLDAQITQLRAEHAAHIERTRAELEDRETRIGALIADLKEAHRPIEALESERDRLRSELTAAGSELVRLAGDLAARDREHAAQIEQLESKAREREAAAAKKASKSAERSEQRHKGLTARITRLRREHAAQVERSQAELSDREVRIGGPIPMLESEHERLRSELNFADRERARLAAELAARDREHPTQIEQLRAEHAAQLGRIQAELHDRDERMGVLIASLKEARRSIPTFEGDVKRLTEELAAKIGMADALDRQTRKVAALLEWTRGALEECDLLVRQLGPCEGAKVLAQIQNSIVKRLGFVSGGPAASAADDCRAVPGTAYRAAALIKIDGSRVTTHALGARTRIGRSTSCELHLDSSSVSRYHALVMVGPRYTVIEDLNSTNGVLVNGRRVKRITLNDGDTLTIGDTYFRCLAPLHDIWTRSDPADSAAFHRVIQ